MQVMRIRKLIVYAEYMGELYNAMLLLGAKTITQEGIREGHELYEKFLRGYTKCHGVGTYVDDQHYRNSTPNGYASRI